jgi:hypothetical protein
MHNSKSTSNDSRASKNVANLFGRRISRDVEILGNFIEQQISDTTAHEFGLETLAFEFLDNLSSAFAYR